MSKGNPEKPLWIWRMAYTKEERRFIWGHIKSKRKLINLFGALCVGLGVKAGSGAEVRNNK